MKKGKLIVIYGINNLGKTTQAKLLVNWLKKQGFRTEYVKYPIYSLKPSGRYINAILRKGLWKKIGSEEIQLWYALNRFQFQPQLLAKLEKGIIVVAEDYVGTGIAWGVAEGALLSWLESVNEPLYKEDASILLDGQRFLSAAEKDHFHESNDALMKRCRKVHLALAKKYGWGVVNANRSRERVHSDITEALETKLNL